MNIKSTLCTLALILTTGAVMADDQWVVYEGQNGPGKGKHIVLVSGDDEYRSEEALPMLGKILAVRHGFKCTVLFAIDPKDGTIVPTHQTNIPGLEALKTADMMIIATRFRELPDAQMQHVVDFTNSGKPILGLRTATHAFAYSRNKDSKFAKYSFNAKDGGWGKQVLGETWVSHHGKHKKESCRGIINQKSSKHPILRGVEDVWGQSDVYGIRSLPKGSKVLMHGQVLVGMNPDDKPLEGEKNNPMMPLVWVRKYTGETGKKSTIINTTMGASIDFECEDLRRLVVNGCYYALGLKNKITSYLDVDYVGDYKPTFYGFGQFKKGIKPSDHKL